MNNSNTTASPCSNILLVQPNIDMERFITYYMVAPIYAVLGLLCHGQFLIALYKQSKKQRAYRYQVFQSMAEVIMVVIRSINILTRFVTNDAPYGQNPFKSLTYSYGFMWYSGHVSAFVSNTVLTTSLLLSASMAADRVFALAKPNKYRLVNHRRYQLVALVLSVSLSFLASLFDCFRNTVVQTATGAYAVMLNYQYVGTTKFIALAACVCTLQITGLIGLIGLSTALCSLYRSNYLKLKISMTQSQDQRKAKKSERTLAMLTLMECIFKAIGTSFPVGIYLTQYASPASFSCVRNLLTVSLDLTMMLEDLGSFFAVICLSKDIRSLLRQALPHGCFGGSQTIKVSATPRSTTKD